MAASADVASSVPAPAPAAAAPPASGPGLDALRAAHAKLLANKRIQFDFAAPEKPPPPPKPPPHWLLALQRFIAHLVDWALPALKILFWVGVGAIALLLVFLIVRELTGVRFERRRRAAARNKPVDWRPDAVKARALLEDADALAAQGRYDEAVRVILFRSIDDIEGRRPRLVRPALTARDIAALEGLPAAARPAFSLIARVVEASFFGGRPVDRAGFADCRQAYEAFAFPEVWA
ncbi:DUF4129 domain-containing protein [Caulobacter sp. KR2-114]|uniref:DUF4129 domain-containing protein n=1 Tax=Caulobacter sp. KR2-114 TaxID=3400912 RepID=UPI003C0A75D6